MRQNADVLVSRLGFWSGLWTAGAVIAFVIGIVVAGIAFPGAKWTGDAAAFSADLEHPLAWSVGEILSLLIIPGWVGIIAAIHCSASLEKKLWSTIALVLTAAYVATVGANDFMQLTTVRLNLIEGTTDDLAPWIKDNPRSFFYPLESLGYAWQTFAAGLAGLVFAGPGMGLWIRRLFAAVALSGVMGIIGAFLGLEFLHPWMVAGNVLYTLTFSLAAVLCALFFRRLGQDRQA